MVALLLATATAAPWTLVVTDPDGRMSGVPMATVSDVEGVRAQTILRDDGSGEDARAGDGERTGTLTGLSGARVTVEVRDGAGASWTGELQVTDGLLAGQPLAGGALGSWDRAADPPSPAAEAPSPTPAVHAPIAPREAWDANNRPAAATTRAPAWQTLAWLAVTIGLLVASARRWGRPP